MLSGWTSANSVKSVNSVNSVSSVYCDATSISDGIFFLDAYDILKHGKSNHRILNGLMGQLKQC